MTRAVRHGTWGGKLSPSACHGHASHGVCLDDNTVGPFTVLKFEDQTFISTFTTEGRPHLLQIQKQIFRRAGSPILLHISERTTFISQQYQSGGNTGVILFQENKTYKFVNTLVL